MYASANMGLFSPAAHYESAVASGISLRTTGLYSPAAHCESAVASGISLRTTGLFSPAAHYESAVATGIRLRQRGCIHMLHIMSLWWLRVSDCGQAEGG